MIRRILLCGGAALAVPQMALAQPADPRGLPAPMNEAIDSNHVDLGSGRLAYDYPGPAIGPKDLNLSLTYLYLLESPSRTNFTGVMEQGNPISQMGPSPYTITLGRRTVVFLKTTNGNILPYKIHGGETLSGNVFTDYDGTIAVFSVAATNPNRWYVSSITKPNGEQLIFTYDTSPSGIPMLRRVTSNAGFALNIAYSAYGNSVTAYNMAVDYCPAPSTVACSHSTNWPSMTGFNGTLTDNLGRQMYVYAGWASAQIKSPEQVATGVGTTNVTYGQSSPGWPNTVYGNADGGKVTSIQTPSGTWSYTYKSDLNAPVGSTRVNWAKRTDPNGRIFEVATYSGGLSYRKDELGRESSWVLDQDFNYAGRIKEGTLPEGNKVAYTYDGRGNITQVVTTPKPGSGQAATTQIASFPSVCASASSCNQPDYIVDANGNRTDYGYYAWGGIKSELGPSVNGVRPLKRWEYVQLYAYVKNASGALVAAGPPIWRPSREIVCKETINATQDGCASPADELVTQYEYGVPGTANSLWLRGVVQDATGTPARTCYSYDNFGNRISETKPRAGLASCN
ncbi:RHS repeat protein [Sphingomonas sp. CBMAI 2297]|uniref:RHS repeat domain-containing protein n=1 Tax=Sphingomonas sp. CBMAI 2297 TaxID=2991720 RepID=UPI002457485E|nr:RHS repeat protein [Sphingomonas sp. CBMAI 2297]MDH4745763.1 RHS repeat protein [Sphingomonas sp. CBMAI 2297]